MSTFSSKKLIQNLDEAFIHLKRLFYAGTHIASFFPLTDELMLTMNEENVSHLDQFIFRFMKLQDCIGQRLFSSLLECLQEDYSSKPFIDVLNRLEKLEIIESTYIWQELRDIRNDIAHEYPENSSDNMKALNELFLKTADLLTIFRSTTEFIEKNLEIKVQQVPDWPPV